MDTLRHRARALRNDATDAERRLWQGLRGRQLEGFRFRRQVPLGDCVVDFACPQARLIVELDGGQHAESAARDYDAVRTRSLEKLGYRVVRFWNDDVLLRTDDVLAEIHRHLTERCPTQARASGTNTPPQPSPSLREREGAEAADLSRAFTEAGFSSLQPGSRDAPSLSPQAKGRVGEGCS